MAGFMRVKLCGGCDTRQRRERIQSMWCRLRARACGCLCGRGRRPHVALRGGFPVKPSGGRAVASARQNKNPQNREYFAGGERAARQRRRHHAVGGSAGIDVDLDGRDRDRGSKTRFAAVHGIDGFILSAANSLPCLSWLKAGRAR